MNLSNNRIPGPSSVYIADIIRQSALKSLDLRWNELDMTNAKSIISALQGNMIITELELNGNKLNEATLNFIDEILSRNNSAAKRNPKLERNIAKVMFSPAKTTPLFFKDEDLDNEMKLAEYRTRYNDEMIEYERTDRRLENAEQKLNQEREKHVEIREELIKAADVEKLVNRVIILIEI